MSGIDPMTHPLTPREKVARIVAAELYRQGYGEYITLEEVPFDRGELCWSYIDQGLFDFGQCADAILTALASGSGDHAELARLAEAATKGPWVCKEGSTSYPECDDKDFWSVVLSPAGKEIVTLHERYASKSDDRGDYDFDAAFIAAANPATVLALLAEISALRAERDDYFGMANRSEDAWHKAERKLAEAVGLLEPFAKLADEEGGYREDDRLAWGLNTADINWGDLRAARTFLSKEAERG